MRDEYAYKKSMIFSICYVGLSTLSLFSLFPGDFFHGDWVMIGLFATFPVSILSFGFLYGGTENVYFKITIIQLLMFLVTWYLSYRFIKKKRT